MRWVLDVGGAVGRDGYLYVVRDVGYGYPLPYS